MSNVKIISAGFAILSNDNKILLGRTTKHNKRGSWTIFKGQRENNEHYIETAIRELKEESGIDIVSDDRLNKYTSSSPFYVFNVGEKTVYVYLLKDYESALENYNFNCSSFFNSEPEISEYKWFTLEDAVNKVYFSQKCLIEKILSIKNSI